jgi:hypothetical protein
VVRSSPADPLFHSGFPLVGGARLDPALCSLATVGPDAAVLVAPPPPLDDARTVEDACRDAPPFDAGRRGRVGTLVRADTALGPAHAYVYAVAAPRGVLVAFTGLAMPASGWVSERFAELAARRGLVTVVPVRDESARPIAFDPLREARRALAVAERVRAACGVPEGALHLVGASMGAMEALLANREVHRQGLAARAAVLDPLLDPPRAASHLDSFWHSAATDGMQAYFRRILSGRYGEPTSTSFTDLLHRSRREAIYDATTDAPRMWLCGAPHEDYALFVSDDDPVLGGDHADFARACGFPVRRSRAPGHVPLGCRLELFDELLEAAAPNPRSPRA